MAPVTLRPWRIPQVLILKLRGLVRTIQFITGYFFRRMTFLFAFAPLISSMSMFTIRVQEVLTGIVHPKINSPSSCCMDFFLRQNIKRRSFEECWDPNNNGPCCSNGMSGKMLKHFSKCFTEESQHYPFVSEPSLQPFWIVCQKKQLFLSFFFFLQKIVNKNWKHYI